jgi:hypothetical protein
MKRIKGSRPRKSPSGEASGYVAFFGCLSPEQGGLPLRIAANLPRSGTRYFKERVEPKIDGTQVRFVGEPQGTIPARSAAFLPARLADPRANATTGAAHAMASIMTRRSAAARGSLC